MFTQRQRKILAILKKHQYSVTSDEIARLVGVSSRTIRTEIKNIMPALREDIAKINISTRKGYSLDILNKNEFDKLLEDNVSKTLDSEARTKYIMERLLNNALANQSIKQQDLADELYIGLSTLKANLKEVKEKLKKYDLDIVNYKNQGMQIKGNEARIRYCISDFIFNNSDDTDFYQKLFAGYDLLTVNNIIIKVISSFELVLTDTAVKNLLVHVLIAIKRAGREHNVMYTLRESREIEQHREYMIATSIFEEIYHQLNIDVATSEIYYLAQHLIASKKYSNVNEETDKYIDQLVNDMLTRVNTIVGINFLHDESLKKWLKVHLEAVIPRIRFQMNIRNEIIDVIKNDKITKSAIIVCGGGIGTAVLLKAKLNEYFKDLINIVKTIPGYQLKQDDVDSVDLIFSTIPLEQLQKKSSENADKIIYIKNLLNNEEMEIISHKFFNTSDISKTNIERFFRRDCFITNMQFDSKEKILSFITGKLEEKGLIDTETTKSIFEREDASPTEIGNLVAIPHPMVNNTAISSISVMVLNKPIMWVEHHVQVIFLISIAKSEFYLWEPIFLKLFNYLVKQNGIKKMIDNPDYDKFIKDFKREFD